MKICCTMHSTRPRHGTHAHADGTATVHSLRYAPGTPRPQPDPTLINTGERSQDWHREGERGLGVGGDPELRPTGEAETCTGRGADLEGRLTLEEEGRSQD